jgi:hypothetical protein
MEPEYSLLSSQEPITGPYHEPDESNPHPYTQHTFYQYYFGEQNESVYSNKYAARREVCHEWGKPAHNVFVGS